MVTTNGVNTTSIHHAVPSGGNDSGVPTAQNIYEAASVADIRATLAHLNAQESSVTARLNALVASQRDLSRDLGRLDLLRANLGSQTVATRSISNGMLSNAASTANRISNAVKRVDLEQSRVKATLDVVEQVAELKTCVLGVTGSMGAPQDWETAAGYLNRASKIPTDITNGSFAEEIVPTAEVPDPPRVTIEHAAESLCGLFLREFEKAAQENNGTKVTRFFKLFPLIGRSEVGLDVYGRYVCQGVASRARSNLHAGTGGTQRNEGFFYANALTKLFEHIAQIVENHGGLVERHYGAGRMVRVIERLQLEADVQGGIVLDTWSDERKIDRKLTDIKSYAFTFLVQSFLPSQPGKSGTPRTGSPANRDGMADIQAREDDGVDMKDVDSLLSEMAVMLGRWSLYSRFLATKCNDPLATPEHDSGGLTMPTLLLNSSLSRKLSDRVISPFNIMTTFFFRRSVEKAFQLDEQPSGLTLNSSKTLSSNPPYITSAVDDVMYIVNQVIQRSLATSQRAVIASVVPTIARVLASDFVGMTQRKMRDESYPKAAIQGALPPEHVIIAFLVLVNNLDVASDYVKRIVQSRVQPSDQQLSVGSNTTSLSPSLFDLYPFNHDAVFVANSLKSLLHSFEIKTSELLGDGIYVVFKNVMKPRLRPILTEAFRDIDYQLTIEELEEASREAEIIANDSSLSEDAVQRRFERGWDALTKPIARILTDHNFDKLLHIIISYLAEVLEKRIWGYHGRVNEPGAVRLERDIAAIVGIVVKGGRYGLRDTFTRCTQICLVMNMEDDEWEELHTVSSNDGVDWRINSEERSRAKTIIKGRRPP